MFYSTKKGAEVLKKRIEDFWKEQGYIVNVQIIQKEFNVKMRLARFELKSDLLNGRPRNWITPKQQS